MEKMDLHSPNMVNQNIESIAKLFPNCVTETADGIKIDFEQLKQELSEDVVDGAKERYRLDWPGKREAIVTSNLPTTATLRPAKDESADFDNTENIYIEGDNLEVLKILQESYLNKIKMIYIDPPYNTGKDFVYRDNFATDVEEWKKSEERNEEGARLVVNPETAGRYHSDWLSMMYPRLKLARNLLTDDGVIFISIDDNEVHNLRKMCDEIFGEGNFVTDFVWTGKSGSEDDGNIRNNHEYVLCYSSNQALFEVGLDIKKDVKFPLYDKKRKEKYKRQLLRKWGDNSKRQDRPNLYYSIKDDENLEFYPTLPNGDDGCWRWSKEKMNTAIKEGYIEFDINQKGRKEAYEKIYESDTKRNTKKYQSLINDSSNTANATRKMREMFNGMKIFDRPKPIELITRFLNVANSKELIVLDFFSGSSTTAHAVMQLNAEDGGNRKYIMVQLPEETDEKSEAYKAGYKTIAEIGKERIRRAAQKIKEETKADIDYGFRVYKLDSSNMKDVYYNPANYTQQDLGMFIDNIKEDRTEEDLVTQVMLDWGLPLSLNIEQKEISGKKVYTVADSYLYCCFDKGLDEAFAKEVAKNNPERIVFRDAGFANDTAKENVKQLLKQLSPDTEMRVV